MKIYSFSPFGYEGDLIEVEVDIRPGISAVDIVGLADGRVASTRSTVKAAIKNSGLEFPQERVLIGLSPCDLKKEGRGFDLAIALAVLDEKKSLGDGKVLVMGELEEDGAIRPVNGVYAACLEAVKAGIKTAVVPKDCALAYKAGIETVVRAGNLAGAVKCLEVL